MSVPARIGILVVAVCAVYSYVGRLVPQKEEHPPAAVGANASPAELAQSGATIFPGACGQCHGAPGAGGTDRAPDLDGIAARAEDRAKLRSEQTGTPYTAGDYLAESLLDSGAYLVEREPGVPYGNIMSFNLAPLEVLAVLAYLQTLGGEPMVTAEGEIWQKWGASLAASGTGAGGGGPSFSGTPDELVKRYKCVDCHDLEGDKIPPGGGPSLASIGSRMAPGDILIQILDPDSQIAEPVGEIKFDKGVMKPALAAFYAEVASEDMVKLALWLSQKRAGGGAPPPPRPGAP
jgi:cytochrome c553